MNFRQSYWRVGIALALSLGTLICYWPMMGHRFISFHDSAYITQNPRVAAGLSWTGVAWALKSGYVCNWHPLTWLSHMLDCELYGLNPAGHHLTNLLLHAANTLLLLLLLHQLTGARWRSAIVAALFAWHPLHVESVAWAAERKDVLSTFFFLLTLGAYARYATSGQRRGLSDGDAAWTTGPRDCKTPKPQDQIPRSTEHGTGKGFHFSHFTPLRSRHYVLAVLLFALGLMSKPMVVTLPFVLLLLDYWPLGRVSGVGRRGPEKPTPWSLVARHGPLLWEKLPFFALAVGSSIVTYLVQNHGRAVVSLQAVPLPLRVANAVVAYRRYLGKTFWPADLTILYPYPDQLPLGFVLVVASLLVLATAFFVRRAERAPYLAVGWLWFLGTLVPTIGLVQVGSQPMADRYMYIPSIGLFVMVVWGLAGLAPSKAATKWYWVLGTGTALGICLVSTRMQLKYWQDGEKVFRHAIDVAPGNSVAYNHLGKALEDQGRKEEALFAYGESVRLKPSYAEGQCNLGTFLMEQGRLEEAISHFASAVRVYPGYATAHNGLGNALFKLSRLAEAQAQLAEAVRLDPEDAGFRYNLGTVLLARLDVGQAVAQYTEAVRLKPDYGEAHRNLGVGLMKQGRASDATLHFAEAARLEPDNPDMRFNYGLALLEQNRPIEAEAQFVEGLRLSPDDIRLHYRLAQALVRQHKSQEAVSEYREALRLAPGFAEAREELAAQLAGDPGL